MIEAFRRIGEETLKEKGDSKEEVLKAISYEVPEEIKKGNEEIHNRPVIIDFDMNKKSIKIYEGDQINNSEKDYFIFEKISSNAKKIFFGSNNMSYHWHLTILDMIKFIEEDLRDNKSLKEFKEFIMRIRDSFYKKFIIKNKNKEEVAFILNIFLIEDKDIIEKSIESYLDSQKKENEKRILRDFFEGLKEGDLENFKISKDFFDKKIISGFFNKFLKEKGISNYVGCFILYFNGEPIQKTKFWEEYRKIVYFANIQRNFEKKGKKGICHLCGNKYVITGKIDIPTKFYMVDKRGFFENVTDKNSYKSFSICEECYKKVLVGINKVKSFSKSLKFSGVPFYIIPYGDSFFNNVNINLNYLSSMIKESFSKTVTELEQRTIEQNFLFDLLFYQPSKNNDFKIIKHIQNISSLEFFKINDEINRLNGREFDINCFFGKLKDLIKYKINIGSISFLLFKERYLDNKKEKDKITFILDIFEAIYFRYFIKKDNFLKFYLESYKKQFFGNKKNKNPYDYYIFSLLLYLKFLYNRQILKNKKMEIKTLIKSEEIDNEKLKEFFKNHEELGDIEKGLIAFGTIINNIISKQLGEKKSATFVNKIDFDGIHKKELIELSNEVEEYLNYYSIGYNPITKNFAFEIISRVSSDKNIHISPQEITFYILFGINIGNYIAKKYKEEKREND